MTTHPYPSTDPLSFRAALSRFPSGVTVITSRDKDGTDYGMTVSAFCSLSLNPPLILVCIDNKATWKCALNDSSHFIVHILSDAQEKISRRFSGEREDRFTDISYVRNEREIVLLNDVLASLECRISETSETGDHTIIVGHVERAQAAEGKPLVYFRSSYAEVVTT